MLEPLVLILPDFILLFDMRRMATASGVDPDDDEAAEADGKAEARKLVKATAEAVDSSQLSQKCEAFRLIARVVGSRARWFEGSDCHKELGQSEFSSHKRKHEEFQKGSHLPTCVWKARRTTHMALGEIIQIKTEISEATSPAYGEFLMDLSPQDRNYIVGMVHEFKVSLIEFYADKFSYYPKIPGKCSIERRPIEQS